MRGALIAVIRPANFSQKNTHTIGVDVGQSLNSNVEIFEHLVIYKIFQLSPFVKAILGQFTDLSMNITIMLIALATNFFQTIPTHFDFFIINCVIDLSRTV